MIISVYLLTMVSAYGKMPGSQESLILILMRKKLKVRSAIVDMWVWFLKTAAGQSHAG